MENQFGAASGQAGEGATTRSDTDTSSEEFSAQPFLLPQAAFNPAPTPAVDVSVCSTGADCRHAAGPRARRDRLHKVEGLAEG